MSERLLRGAVIGLGNVAINGHLPGWRSRSDASIVAATDLRPEQSATLREHLPSAAWYDSSEALYAAEELDFVDICTPPGQHAAEIRMALEHGMHVLCEKPLVSAVEELAPIAALAQRRQRVLHTIHNWMQAPPIRKVTMLLERGTIGEVTDCRWETIRDKPAAAATSGASNWRTDPRLAGGGILVDHGWHALYVVLGWIRRPPLGVSAVLENRRYTNWSIEDTATVKLFFAETNAEIMLTWAGDRRENRAELVGTAGTISLADGAVSWRNGSEARGGHWEGAEALTQGSHHPSWFNGVVDEFIAAVTNTHGSSPGNLAEASLCARLIDLAKKSSRRGGATETL